jgi:hypothetical protein
MVPTQSAFCHHQGSFFRQDDISSLTGNVSIADPLLNAIDED